MQVAVKLLQLANPMRPRSVLRPDGHPQTQGGITRQIPITIALLVLTLLGTTVPAAAQATRRVVVETRVEIDEVLFSPCEPQLEPVHMRGEDLFLFTYLVTPAERVQSRTVVRTRIQGQGLDTNRPYQVLQIGTGVDNTTIFGGQDAGGSAVMLRMRAPGGREYLLRQLFRITTTPNGTTTVIVDKLTFVNECF